MDTPEGAPRPVLAAPDCAVSLHGFAAVPARLVADRSISHTELRLLLALAAHAGPEQECWPGVERLAAIVNLTGRQVRRVLRSLERSGYVQVFKRERQDGTQTSNLYRLRFSRWDESGNPEAGTPPGGRQITNEDPDKNVRAVGAECQGPPDTIMSAPLIEVEPNQKNQDRPPNPPQAGDTSSKTDQYPLRNRLLYQPPGKTTRKEKDLIREWERAVGETCHECGRPIELQEVAHRDCWGILRSGVMVRQVPIGPAPRDMPPGCESIGPEVRAAATREGVTVSPYDFANWIVPISAQKTPSGTVLWFVDQAARDYAVDSFADLLGETFPDGYSTNFVQRHQEHESRLVHARCVDFKAEKPGSGHE